MGGGKMTPSPGSPKATDQGCTCPVFDNCKGRGCGLTDKDGKPLYYIHKRCPLLVAKEVYPARAVIAKATGENT